VPRLTASSSWGEKSAKVHATASAAKGCEQESIGIGLTFLLIWGAGAVTRYGFTRFRPSVVDEYQIP
jgi:hypothetical protein